MPYAKAIVGAIVAFLAALLAEWSDVDALVARDFVVAALAAMVTLVAVFAVPNTPSR